MAVVATLSKGYDLDYIWKQVDRGLARDAATYYIQASEAGGEPPGRWWGPGAKALGFEQGQRVERKPYDLLFGRRQAPGEATGQHVPDDLADERAERVEVAAHETSRRASSAAPAACRTSASVPDRYSRPVAPIIR